MKKEQLHRIILVLLLLLLLVSGFSWGTKNVWMQEGQTIRLICPASSINTTPQQGKWINGEYYVYVAGACQWGLD